MLIAYFSKIPCPLLLKEEQTVLFPPKRNKQTNKNIEPTFTVGIFSPSLKIRRNSPY